MNLSLFSINQLRLYEKADHNSFKNITQNIAVGTHSRGLRHNVRVCSKQFFTFLSITAIMAPLPESSIKAYLSSIFKRAPSPQPSALVADLSPKAAAVVARAQNILPRDANPGAGVTPPANIPNKAVFVLFGLIGLGFVVTGIWFFFWAKNGGFYFKENDWDDYKSTVLRRKGPNGTTLSGATATTDLGGGSIVHGEKRNKLGRKKKGMKRYKDFDDDESSQMTGSNGGSELASEMSELKYQAKQVVKKEKIPGVPTRTSPRNSNL